MASSLDHPRVARPFTSGLAATGGGQPSSQKDDCHPMSREAHEEQNSAYRHLGPAITYHVHRDTRAQRWARNRARPAAPGPTCVPIVGPAHIRRIGPS